MDEIEPGRDKLGRFTSGNEFNTPERRKRNKPEFAVALSNLEENFPSATIGAELRSLLDVLMKEKKHKDALRLWELVMAYAFGKPMQRQVTVRTDLDDFLRAFAPREGHAEDSAEDSEFVEGEIVS